MKNKFNPGDMVTIHPVNTLGVKILHGQIEEVTMRSNHAVNGCVYKVVCGSLILIDVPEHTINVNDDIAGGH